MPQLVVALRYEAARKESADAARQDKADVKDNTAKAKERAPAALSAVAVPKAPMAASEKQKMKEPEPEIDEDSSMDAEAVSDPPGDVEVARVQ